MFGLIRKKPRVISLVDLSKQWAGDPQPQQSDQAQNDTEPIPAWAHAEITQFYTRVNTVLPPGDPARAVITQILTMLDEQGDCPAEIPTQNGSSISLRDYTLETANIVFDMVSKAYPDPETVMGKMVIIALAHWLGVVSSAEVLGGIPAKSILIVGNLTSQLSYKDKIAEAIKTFTENRPKTQEARTLKAASARARKNLIERTRVLSQTRRAPIIDIETIKQVVHAPLGGGEDAKA